MIVSVYDTLLVVFYKRPQGSAGLMRSRHLPRNKGTAAAEMTRRAFPARGLRRPATVRLAALALVGVLGVFAFADGLHSVHHLPDQDAASRCALAAASANGVGVTVDPVPFALPPLPRLTSVEEYAPAPPVRPPLWVAQNRAPPLARS